jgi:hypothetical protein
VPWKVPTIHQKVKGIKMKVSGLCRLGKPETDPFQNYSKVTTVLLSVRVLFSYFSSSEAYN